MEDGEEEMSDKNIYLTAQDKFVNFLMDYTIIPIVVFCLLFVAYGMFKIFKEDNSPTFELHKNQWYCSANHTERHCSKGCYILTVCDQWSAK